MYFTEGNALKIVHRMSSDWCRSWSIDFNRGRLASSRGHLGLTSGNVTRDQNLSNSEEYWFEREILRPPCLRLVLINCSDGASLCSSDWDWYVSVCIILFYFGFTIQIKDIFLSTYPGRLAQCLPLKTIVDLQISDKKDLQKMWTIVSEQWSVLDLHGNAGLSFEIRKLHF